MMQFDGYRWEDHVPRPGRWRFDLALAALAFAVLAMALRLDPLAGSASVLAENARTAPFIGAAPGKANRPAAAHISRPPQAKAELFCAAVAS
jgi:hypothetical protein